MKISVTLLIAPLLIATAGCSTHYSAGHHSGYHHGHHSNVSVGVHGNYRGSGGSVLGALIVGGVIGHLITEAANHEDQPTPRSSSSSSELVDGYPISSPKSQPAEVNSEQNRFYQLGKDGNCYLMEKSQGEVTILSMVPKYSCN